MIQAVTLNVMYCTGKTPKHRKSKYITTSLSNILLSEVISLMILPVHGFQQILPLAKVTDTTAKTRKSKTIFVISLLSDDSESH